MERVISGIRPTGNLHLGNYFGAVKSFVKMQDEYDCMFFIADWHSLTTHPTPENIRQSVKTILSEYLACGIDPETFMFPLSDEPPKVWLNWSTERHSQRMSTISSWPYIGGIQGCDIQLNMPPMAPVGTPVELSVARIQASAKHSVLAPP